MKTNLYIPKTITVGFQKRSDTFTGKLAYVIYTDHKGVLRKEASWNSWRNTDIEAITFDNTPNKGFTLNKGVQRDGYWGSGRSVIRVWDPRDFEFEISVDNLIGILMHADVSKRDITEPCVFAWNQTELILLPTNSIEYQESVQHTAKQEQKFSAKELKLGYSYHVRREDRVVVYLGYLDRYQVENEYGHEGRYYLLSTEHQKKPKKGHVFVEPNTKRIEVKDPSAFVSSVALEEVHPDLAGLLDTYYHSTESQPAAGLDLNFSTAPRYGYYNDIWMRLNNTDFVQFTINQNRRGSENVFSFAKFARYSGTESKVHFSVPGSNSYYRQQPPVNLPGLQPADDRVTQLIKDASVDYAKQYAIALSEILSNESEYTKAYNAHKQAIVQTCKLFNLGPLHFVLADGKISTDHSF